MKSRTIGMTVRLFGHGHKGTRTLDLLRVKYTFNVIGNLVSTKFRVVMGFFALIKKREKRDFA